MKRIASLCLALGLALSLGGVAAAQQEDEDRQRRVIYRPVTEIDMGETDVQGVLKGPHLEYLPEQGAPVFNPLIKLREDFDPEILQSVHEL